MWKGCNTPGTQTEYAPSTPGDVNYTVARLGCAGFGVNTVVGSADVDYYV